jgi:hypothetical protein
MAETNGSSESGMVIRFWYEALLLYEYIKNYREKSLLDKTLLIYSKEEIENGLTNPRQTILQHLILLNLTLIYYRHHKHLRKRALKINGRV